MLVSFRTVARHATAIAIAFALVSACPRAARAQAQPLEPHRAARIRIACADAMSSDAGHYVVAATLALVGGAMYVPNIVEDRAIRAPAASLETGMALGLITAGAILALRPVGPGGQRLVELCDRIAHDTRDNQILLRDAERLLNALSISYRSFALAESILGALVTILGVGIAVPLFLSANDPRNAAFWSGAFLTVPLCIWTDMLNPAPPLRAGLRFHRGGYRVPRVVSSAGIFPIANGAMVGVGGSF